VHIDRRVTLHQSLAEETRARPGCVAELLPAVRLVQPLCAERQVPVQQEQRCEALLTIKRPQRSILDIAIDDVEAHRLAKVDCAPENLEKALANLPSRSAFASLRIITLDQRNLDVRDRRRSARPLGEQAVVRRNETPHA